MKEIDYKFLNGKILSISDEHLLDTATPTSILTLSPSPTTTPSPIPTPTTIPTPTITPTPVPTHIPQPQVSPEDIHGFMERFAGQYGIDVNVLRHIAVCESGFNPLAINALYAGLFQFNTSDPISAIVFIPDFIAQFHNKLIVFAKFYALHLRNYITVNIAIYR